MTPRTKALYKARVKYILDENKNEINLEKLQSKSKNYISQCKNALKYHYRAKGEFFYSNEIDKLYDTAKKNKKKKKETLQLKNLVLKLNAIRNKKFKTLCKLQLISGLRVEEISKLDLNKDVEYVENNRIVLFVHGKGGKIRKIKTLPDEYVYKNLKKIDKPYAYKTLMNKAYEYKFNTHDFRRTFAQIIYYKTGNKELVKKLLGHEKLKTTEIYIKRDINFNGTKWDF